ncbi:hypothetical protein [Streptomyces mayteni]
MLALPADEALIALASSSWRILDRHLGLFTVVSTTLTPAQMRQGHERVLVPLRHLLLRGQERGTIRAGLPAEWLVSVYYSLIHTAAAEVQAGRPAGGRRRPGRAVQDAAAAMRPQSGG